MFPSRTGPFLLFLCLLLIRGNADSPQPRIVGGHVVQDRRQFAFQISLRYDGWPMCGGSIIDTRNILTAAHCVTNNNGKVRRASRYTVVVGDLRTDKTSPTTARRQVRYIFVHERYDPNTIVSDVAILRIDSLIFNPNVNRIPLADAVPQPNTNCSISGWGLTEFEGRPSAALLYTHVPLVSDVACRVAYGPNLLPGMICAGYYGRDSCSGDSGGPLVCGGLQVGIVSWGVGCGDPEFPGVYASVPHYLSWILRQQHRSTSSNIFPSKYIVLLANALILLYTIKFM